MSDFAQFKHLNGIKYKINYLRFLLFQIFQQQIKLSPSSFIQSYTNISGTTDMYYILICIPIDVKTPNNKLTHFFFRVNGQELCHFIQEGKWKKKNNEQMATVFYRKAIYIIFKQ